MGSNPTLSVRNGPQRGLLKTRLGTFLSLGGAAILLLAERPYGMTMTVDEALRELRRCAGTQFDPRVVNAFQASMAAPSPALRAA